MRSLIQLLAAALFFTATSLQAQMAPSFTPGEEGARAPLEQVGAPLAISAGSDDWLAPPRIAALESNTAASRGSYILGGALMGAVFFGLVMYGITTGPCSGFICNDSQAVVTGVVAGGVLGALVGWAAHAS